MKVPSLPVSPVPELPIHRVLMTADSAGGIWTYAMELSRGLSACGIEVCLAITGAPLSSYQREQALAIPNLTLRESPHRVEWIDHSQVDSARVSQWCLGLESEFRPDVVHLNDFAYGNLPWSTPVLIVGHACVYSWFGAVKRTRPPIEWEGYREKVRQGLRAADAVTAPTHWMLAALKVHYGTFNALPCIPNGRGHDQHLSDEKEAIILTSGRSWDEAKNVQALDRIAPQLEWPVYVMGDEPHSYPSHPPKEGARRLGRLSPQDVACWMGRASIFALPARYEPFGMSVLEAALAGCALVLGDIPSFREIWGDSAIYVKPDEAHELRHVLERLMSDRQELALAAAKAHARGSDLTPENMTTGYLQAYGHTIRKSNKPRTPVINDVLRDAPRLPEPV